MVASADKDAAAVAGMIDVAAGSGRVQAGPTGFSAIPKRRRDSVSAAHRLPRPCHHRWLTNEPHSRPAWPATAAAAAAAEGVVGGC